MHSSLTMRPERARAAVRRTAIVAATATLLLGALVPTVAAADGLSVTTAYPAVAVAPGAKASFDLKVTSTVQGNVALTVSGVPTGWTATLHGGGFVVDGVLAGPGIDATVRLDVQVPGRRPAGEPGPRRSRRSRAAGATSCRSRSGSTPTRRVTSPSRRPRRR